MGCRLDELALDRTGKDCGHFVWLVLWLFTRGTEILSVVSVVSYLLQQAETNWVDPGALAGDLGVQTCGSCKSQRSRPRVPETGRQCAALMDVCCEGRGDTEVWARRLAVSTGAQLRGSALGVSSRALSGQMLQAGVALSPG